MERIQAAIQKAKGKRGDAPARAGRRPVGVFEASSTTARATNDQQEANPAWDALPEFEPDPKLMMKNRVITFADTDPSHTAFDMLRTRILRTMRQNDWVSLGITSPTASCGKTMTSLNLAFSLAHQPDLRTVLVDLDLRRPMVGKTLGIERPQSMASMLQGTRPIVENFVRHGSNLAIGTNAAPIRNSSELLLNAATTEGVARLRSAFQPDVIIYDLPPMMMSDDAMAFLPHMDCMLLVAGAEKTSLDEVDTCERELSENTNLLGVVLNQCRYTSDSYGYY
ncbi:CpsD/CapB family tyrosine-protein kinase [Amaricoccus tamworthensis]|uniref:CpsD/CapB family tyrosine-protein kinase n=1 Tax=Amaricoccus tamworthensis TaxID=57002 RepID=UPI003C7B768B